MVEVYDKIIIGAGFYGLYAALFCGDRGEHILVLECDAAAFGRATYINQARVHQGYHYPRSLSTAIKSAKYFERFNKDYHFCINSEFEKIYATSTAYSWTDGEQFKKFCKAADVLCEELPPGKFFKEGVCDAAFLTREYTYDASMLRDFFLNKIEAYPNIELKYSSKIYSIWKEADSYKIEMERGMVYASSYVLNATYASVNQILNMLGYETFKIKYELCEIILCDVNDMLKKYGITVMDGPFFSIMPFGRTGYHSLTSVTFTPHTTCYDELPAFSCQKDSGGSCSADHLDNCNFCEAKPESAFAYMSHLARKYLKEELWFEYRESLFSMKPILISSEIDDSRPTIIKVHSRKPTFISVLSGKINTVYDLEEVLSDEE